MLAWDAEAGKVGFVRALKFPPRKTAANGHRACRGCRQGTDRWVGPSHCRCGSEACQRDPVGIERRRRRGARQRVSLPGGRAGKVAMKTAAPKASAARTGSLQPSAALAAVIRPGLFARTEVVKALGLHQGPGLRNAKDKRTIIVADAALRRCSASPR